MSFYGIIILTKETRVDQTIKEKIKQRRAQMLVHSRLYYMLDTNIISDDKWQEWANELASLQQEHPDKCKIDFFDDDFKEWTGASGNFLPLDSQYAVSKGKILIEMNEKEGYIG